jgi:hypothetical protein
MTLLGLTVLYQLDDDTLGVRSISAPNYALV